MKKKYIITKQEWDSIPDSCKSVWTDEVNDTKKAGLLLTEGIHFEFERNKQ